MISGLGIDIVDNIRFERKLKDTLFLETIFTKRELEYALKKAKPAQHLAARFAAKESYMKALGTGWTNHADFTEIEIQNHPSGQPFITLYGDTKSYFEKSNMTEIFVSLSHTASQAIAQVIITK